MTTRTYAPWVEPIAARLQQQRAELVELARAIPAEAWSKPSPNEGWTYRDLLGHVATRDARDWPVILQAVVTRTPLDPAALRPEEEVPVNDGLLGKVDALAVEEVIEQVVSDTEALLVLMAQLQEDDKDLRQSDFPMSLGEALALLPNHEDMHMEQLRTALE